MSILNRSTNKSVFRLGVFVKSGFASSCPNVSYHGAGKK
jgi:hypothetical protein